MRRAALAAILAATSWQGAVTTTAGDPANPLGQSHPPLPVRTNPHEESSTSPRPNPFCKVPSPDGLVTLTGGALPEPTLLRPTTNTLTLQPIEGEAEPAAEEDQQSTLRLGQPRRNAFVDQTSSAKRTSPASDVASQASFDHNEGLEEVGGAVTFSFSDASDAAAESSAAGTLSEKAEQPELAVHPDPGDGPELAEPPEFAEPPATEMVKPGLPLPDASVEQSAPNACSDSDATVACAPQTVHEAAPVMLAPIQPDVNPGKAPVVVSSPRDLAPAPVISPRKSSSDAREQRQQRQTKPSVRTDAMPAPTLLRPAEPMVVADDSSRSTQTQRTETDERPRPPAPRPQQPTSKPSDETKPSQPEAAVVTKKTEDALEESRVTDRAPIVIDRGAAAKIGTVLPQENAAASLVTQGSLVVIDVPGEVETAMTAAPPRAASKQELAAQEPSKPPAKATPQTAAVEQVIQPSEADNEAKPSAKEEFLAAQPSAGDVVVATAEVGSLSVGRPVHCFAVEDNTVCQVMATSSTELRVIGQKEGKTRVAVWTGPRSTTRPSLYTIQVTAAAKQEQESLFNAANKLNLTLLQTFPGVDVRVTAGEGNLSVHGSTQGDEQARRILRLVRQACLVPVIDNIVVR